MEKRKFTILIKISSIRKLFDSFGEGKEDHEPIAVQWWSVWYPGAEPGGGGYIAQRMLSAKDEKNAFQILY